MMVEQMVVDLSTLRLEPPTVAYHQSFLESFEEWGGQVQHGVPLNRVSGEELTLEELRDPVEFAHWVDDMRAWERGERLPDEWVPATTRWITDGVTYIGSIQLRHWLNDHLLYFGGHIGYGVRPSARGQGVTSWALQQMLDIARGMGMQEVLLTCEAENEASRNTILGGGGQQVESSFIWNVEMQRFWIEL